LIGEAAIRTSTSPGPGPGHRACLDPLGAAPGASITSARMVWGKSVIRSSASLGTCPQPDTGMRALANPSCTGITGANGGCAMKLWVGLGNPGAKYAGNRHNIGWMAVDRIASDHGFAPFRAKFQGALERRQFWDPRRSCC
jgi:hypothetical protein